MRQAAVSFVVAACWIMCFLRRRGRKAPRRVTATTVLTSAIRRTLRRSTTATRATPTTWTATTTASRVRIVLTVLRPPATSSTLPTRP
jgi:hypothetical protein